MSSSLGLGLGMKRSGVSQESMWTLLLSDLVSGGDIDGIVVNIVETATDNFTGINNDPLNSVLWVETYEHGADIDTTASKVDIQSNAAHFAVSHTGAQVNIVGINILSLVTLDLSGGNQYRVTIKVKHQAGAGILSGVAMAPRSGIGAWNVFGDATNSPNMFGCYTASGGSSIITRYRRNGVNDVANTSAVTATDTNYHTFELTVSATAIETKYDGVSKYSGSVTNALDSTTKVILFTITNGSSVSGVSDFDDFVVERLL